MHRAFFTSISSNYLDKALALAESIFENYPDGHFYISVLNFRLLSKHALTHFNLIKDGYETKGNFLYFIDPLLLYREPDNLVYKFSMIEACTAIKPAVAQKLLERYQHVTYFDPDIIVFNPLPEDKVLGDSWDFQVTPHILSPPIQAGKLSERLFLNFGVFNLGYFSVRDTLSSKQFLEWWKLFCINCCVISPQLGLFVDQKAVDLVGCFVDRLSILRNPGCNVAWWNLFCDGRVVLKDQKISYRSNVEKLYFFHFSNLDNSSDEKSRLISKPLDSFHNLTSSGTEKTVATNPAMLEIFEDYRERLDRMQIPEITNELSFNTTYKKVRIRGFVRTTFLEANLRGMKNIHSPFNRPQILVFISCFVHIVRTTKGTDIRLFLKFIKQLIDSMLHLSLAKFES
jgi:hypothetical protein